MPYREHVGNTSVSMARTRIEYGGCSVTMRCRRGGEMGSRANWTIDLQLPGERRQTVAQSA
jgi:hypothetical protein